MLQRDPPGVVFPNVRFFRAFCKRRRSARRGRRTYRGSLSRERRGRAFVHCLRRFQRLKYRSGRRLIAQNPKALSLWPSLPRRAPRDVRPRRSPARNGSAIDPLAVASVPCSASLSLAHCSIIKFGRQPAAEHTPA